MDPLLTQLGKVIIDNNENVEAPRKASSYRQTRTAKIHFRQMFQQNKTKVKTLKIST